MIFHPIDYSLELPQKFTYPFCYKPHAVCLAAAEQLIKHITCDKSLENVARQGKMFGVLVVKNKNGETGFLCAYSGTTCYDFDNSYFVPPVFDYLKEDGFFKIGEKEITEINRAIVKAEKDPRLNECINAINEVKSAAAQELSAYKAKAIEAKNHRNILRQKGCTPGEEEKMKNESRFFKAEYKRLKFRKDKEIEKVSELYNDITLRIDELKQLRKQKSDALQEKLFRHFEMLDKDGNRKNVCDIFKEYGAGIPPAGTGECCAPKMIQYAFANGFELVAMAEFWYGATPSAEIRHHLHYYPSCMGKCKPLLTYMLRGIDMDDNPMEQETDCKLDVIFEDDYIIVINKPSGMPSVDGKLKMNSAEKTVREMCHNENVKAVHRLDMDTSGILVLAKDEKTYVKMQKMFAERNVKKRYTALLDGELNTANGRISLPLSADYINRPMQKVDYENGKPAVTSFRVDKIENGVTRISLVPITGRTHQLRVHCAHKNGLNMPILGDNLYGKSAERLMLHASYIEFEHPVFGNKISLKSLPRF